MSIMQDLFFVLHYFASRVGFGIAISLFYHRDVAPGAIQLLTQRKTSEVGKNGFSVQWHATQSQVDKFDKQPSLLYD